jgi:predicted dehydrogenase
MLPKIIQVGIGGHGGVYLKYILDKAKQLPAELIAVIDPFADKSSNFEKIKELNIPIFDTLEDFYKENQADLAIIVTPIHLHSQQSCYAMEHGSDVLCEKPISGTLEDALKMQKTSLKTGRNLAIGYQLAFDDVIQQLKTKILNNELGKPENYKCCVCWSRTKAYYERNNWAGRIVTDSGIQIFDSPLNNATAHYLNIMYYLAGKEQTTSAYPKSMKSEVYRANETENFDTAFLKVKTNADVDIFFETSHAVHSNRGPFFELHFEKATVTFESQVSFAPKIRYKDGRPTENLEALEQNQQNKLLKSIENIGKKEESLCSIESAMPHLLTVNKIQEDIKIIDFPQVLIKKESKDNDDELTYTIGLKEVMIECFEENKLPSEAGILWSKSAREQSF